MLSFWQHFLQFGDLMTTFEDPVIAIIKKMRLNSSLLSLLPASHIHSSYPNSENDNPSVYVFAVRIQRKPALSSANQTTQVYNGPIKLQVEAYSTESQEASETLGRVACEATGPSISTAGLWCFDYEFRGSDWDAAVESFRSIYHLNSECTEWRGST
jgi:hypothetical protein